jgi:hypothetical protein
LPARASTLPNDNGLLRERAGREIQTPTFAEPLPNLVGGLLFHPAIRIVNRGCWLRQCHGLESHRRVCKFRPDAHIARAKAVIHTSNTSCDRVSRWQKPTITAVPTRECSAQRQAAHDHDGGPCHEPSYESIIEPDRLA